MRNPQKPKHTLLLKIAAFNIRINFFPSEPPFLIEKNLFEKYKFTYRGFLESKIVPEDFTIDFFHKTEFKVLINNKKSDFYINFYKKESSKRISTYYHLSDFQFQVILRNVIQQLLAKNQGLFIHASASLVNGKAAVFLGPSSAGKSTIVRLLSKKYESLADDSIFIVFEKGSFIAYQTPILEKNLWIIRKYRKIELGGIFLLKKATSSKIIKLNNKEEVTSLLLKQVLTDKPDLKEQIPDLLKLASNFDKFYILEFSLKDEKNLVELLKSNV